MTGLVFIGLDIQEHKVVVADKNIKFSGTAERYVQVTLSGVYCLTLLKMVG